MKLKLILIILIAVLLESIVIAYPATELTIAFFSIFIGEEIAFLAFGAGMLLDLLTVRSLGVDSLYFLSLIYLGGRYQKKIQEGTFVYRFLYLFVSFVIYSLLFYKSLNVVSVLITMIGLTGLLLFSERIFPGKEKKRLAV